MPTTSYLDQALYPASMRAPALKDVKTPSLPGGFKGPFGGRAPKVGPPSPVGNLPAFDETGARRTPDPRDEIAGLRFVVTIDGHDLGNWFKVDGLAVKFEIAEYREGNARNRRWIEPCYTTYTNVKLSRVTTLRYTSRIMQWLETTSFTSRKVTATITGYPHWHDRYSNPQKVEWNLGGVLPVAWSGPQFDASTGKLATETLELAHEGFLEADA